jgi:23S rRNA (cytidine1920-2'-O)/16S rRNA (cytidine1409-2'-O)-methyltransferase
VSLADRLAAAGTSDPVALITAGRVIVDGRIIQNPNARVPADASIVIRPERVLKGTRKLGVARASSGVDPKGAICLGVGASTGGFTTALLDRGAALVYAVDVGHGQLRGALARDPA